MPKMLALDPTNLCDLKCPLCPTGLRDKTVERGSIKLEQFKTIIDQLAKHLQSINLYSWGEPLLHKSLVHMIRHTAINHKVRTITSVHLGNLSDEQVEGLATSGLDKLIVSVDGATQEVYEKYRVGGDIEKVFTNMKRLMEAKKRHNSKVNVIWNFLVMKQNEHQMDMAKKRAKKIGVEITFSIMRTNLNDDILGKHVNLSALILRYSTVGGVVISDKVYQNISNVPEFETKYISQPIWFALLMMLRNHCSSTSVCPTLKEPVL